MVVISVDPPIRKGQTFYPHLLAQFDSDETVEPFELDITDEQLAAKNREVGLANVAFIPISEELCAEDFGGSMTCGHQGKLEQDVSCN